MQARDREVGRRISALRSGLSTAVDHFDALVLEAQECAPGLVGQIEEAKGDAEAALVREQRMRERQPTGGE